MAPSRPKRQHTQPPMAQKTPPEVKKLKREKKNDVNCWIALELVQKTDSDRQRAAPELVKGVFDKYATVYGEDLVDKRSVYRFKKDILDGKASSWLPPDTQLPTRDVVVTDEPSTISGLTNDSSVSTFCMPTSASPAASARLKDPPSVPKNKGGRPKGSTAAAKAENEERLKEAYIEATLRYGRLRKERGKKKRNRNPSAVLRQVESEFGIPPFMLKLDTVKSRHKRGNATGKGKAHVSPVASMEPVLLDFCIKLARMGQPLDKEQVVTLANDLIKDTET